MASIITVWPFQRARRPGSMTTGTPSGRFQRAARLATRSEETAPGSKPTMSMPRWMVRSRSSPTP